MKTQALQSSGRVVKTRVVLPRSLVRKVNAAARAGGSDADGFIARAIAREPYRSPAPMLSADETDRLALLSAKLRTSPAKAVRAILLNALGVSFYPGNSLQSRVIELSNAMHWA